MVSRYNNGEISNEEMRTFLVKVQGGMGLSANDKLEISNQIKDFDSRIQGEALTARFKSAPDNSIDQVQAAKAIADFYSTRAASQAAGTPAQSQSLANAADWNAKYNDINQNIKKIGARNLRYQEEAKVNAIADNTSEQALRKAEMYKTLYERAVNDGDEVDANKYAAYYQDAITSANTLATREDERATAETKRENKTKLTDFINTTLNDYHDGKISGDTALASLEQANQFAYDIDDTAALNRLNGLAITIQREIDKGITYSNVNGLSTKSKGGGTGTGEIYLNPDGSITYGGGTSTSSKGGGGKVSGGVKTSGGKVLAGSSVGGSGTGPKSLTQMEIEYKNDLNEANKALVNGYGVIDGKKVPFDAKKYVTFVTAVTKKRQLELENIQRGLDELSANGVKKVGKQSVEELRKKTSTELGQVTASYNGVKSGNLVLAMKNKDFTDATGNKSSKPQLAFVPKKDVAGWVNAQGIYYPTRSQAITFDLANRKAAEAYVKNNPGTSIQQSPEGFYAIVDGDGNQVKKSFVDVTDTNGNSITYESDSKYGWIPVAGGPKTSALREQIIKEFDTAVKTGKIYEPKLLGYNQVVNYQNNNPVGTFLPQPAKPPTTTQKVTGAIGDVVEAGKDLVSNVVAPRPITPINQDINIPNGVVFSKPQQQQIQQSAQTLNSSNAVRSNAPSQPLKLATQTPSPVAKLAQSTGAKPVAIAAPPVSSLPKAQQVSSTNFDKQAEELRKKANQSVTQKVTGAVKSLATKIGGLFK